MYRKDGWGVDSQKAKVYKAERTTAAWKDGRMTVMENIKEVEAYARSVMGDDVVKSKYKELDLVVKEITRKNCKRASGGASYFEDGHVGTMTRVISLPAWSFFKQLILHELAHTIIQSQYKVLSIAFDNKRHVAGHGWQFCKLYLDLVDKFLGREARIDLEMAFEDNRVKFTQPKERKVIQ